MAGLQRVITYIYKYENDEKIVNAGFAKVEVRGTTCRMEVHIRNIATEQQSGMVYLFARREKIMHSVPVGNINISGRNGDVRYSFETGGLKKFGILAEELEGIFIPLENNVYLASQWREGEIRENYFKIAEEINLSDKKENEDVKENNSEEITRQENEEENENIIQKENNKENQSQNFRGKINQQTNSREENEKAAQQETDKDENEQITQQENRNANQNNKNFVRNTMRATAVLQEEANLKTDENWQAVFTRLRQKLPEFYPFEKKNTICVRMELKDIHEFPKKYWYLGNNSFLLHGFFNYGHLIFGENQTEAGTEYLIGIPGVFQNQERLMAAMFGFPEFQTAKNETQKTGNFGYWYRII